MNETAPGDEEFTGKLFDMAAYRAGEGGVVRISAQQKDEHVLPKLMPADDHDQVLVNWQIARNEFARLSAGRSSRTLHFGRSKEFSEEALLEAKNTYDLHRKSLMGHQAVLAYASGTRGEELEKHKAEIAEDQASSLAVALFSEREIATTLFARATDRNGDPMIEYYEKTPLSDRLYSKNKLGHSIRRAYWWWGRQNDGTKQGKINRAGATLALGLPFGVVGAALAPLAAGAIGVAGATAAAAAMTRVSKSAMVFHLDKHGRSARQINGLQREIDEAIKRGEAESVANLVLSQAKESVKDNRKRASLAAVTVLGGTALGELVHLLLPGGANVHAHPQSRANLQPANVDRPHPSNPLKPVRKLPAHKPSLHPARLPRSGAENRQIYVNPSHIGKAFVSSVYQKAEGIHKGFNDMIYAARSATARGDLATVHTSSGSFWYKVTNKGAKEFAKGAPGSDKTVNVMRVLSHFGRISILHR